MSAAGSERGGMGRGTRLSFGLQIAVALVLAVAAAVLAMEVADWSYVRVDLSADGRNTLDPATVEMVRGLPEEAGDLEIETFLRPLAPEFGEVSAQALAATSNLLTLVHVSLRDRVDLVHHDMTDLGAVQARQQELGISGENLVVVRLGERLATLRVFGDLAVVDWGNPTIDGVRYLSERGIPNAVDPRSWRQNHFEKAWMQEFRGEEAFVAAVAKVSAGGSTRVLFSVGQGERTIDGTTSGSFAPFATSLARDGYDVGTWDPLTEGGVPEDCEVLILAGPKAPFPPEGEQELRDYLDRGGRVLAFLGLGAPTGPGSLAQLLEDHGITPAPGVVCEPVADRLGNDVEGFVECATLMIRPPGMAADNTITEPLRRHRRTLQFSHTPSFDIGPSPQGGQVLPLLHADRDAWRDLFDARGALDYALDPAREEAGRRFVLAAAAQFVGSAEPGPLAADHAGSRLVAVASTNGAVDRYFGANRDFLMNCVHWLADREHRVSVTPRQQRASVLDVSRSGALAGLTWGLGLGLPALFGGIGLVVARRRRRA